MVHGGLGSRRAAAPPGPQDGMSPLSPKNCRELGFFGAGVWGSEGLQDLLETQLPLKYF